MDQLVNLWVTDQQGHRLTPLPPQAMRYVNTDVLESPNHTGDVEGAIVNLHDAVKYQTVGGIGGAFTDASASLWMQMPLDRRQELIRAYFDRETGIGYTFGRLSIGSCDFSTEDYTYVDEGDATLSTFTLAHDRQAVFPMVKAAQQYADLTLMASPWSPPAYMKTNHSRIGGHLKKDCYPLWARYLRKYVDACRQEGIAISLLSIQNEPRHHQIWESCLYTPDEEIAFLGVLGEALQGSGIRILCYDHCRERVFERAAAILNSENGHYCDGIAHHWYSGDHFGELRAFHAAYPDKLSVASEGCCVVPGSGIKPELDLPFAEKYAHDLCGCFQNGLNSYCDWNLLLDEHNGPYHNRDGRPCSAEAPVYFIRQTGELLYRLSYYYIGHYSKFVRPGARVIASSSHHPDLETVAFQNPDASLVCVLLNRTAAPLPCTLRHNGCIAPITLQSHSIATAVIPQ